MLAVREDSYYSTPASNQIKNENEAFWGSATRLLLQVNSY